LAGRVDGRHGSADVAIVDARTDPEAAQKIGHQLTTESPAVAVVAVVAPAATAGADGQFDDVVLPGTVSDELQERLGRSRAGAALSTAH